MNGPAWTEGEKEKNRYRIRIFVDEGRIRQYNENISRDTVYVRQNSQQHRNSMELADIDADTYVSMDAVFFTNLQEGIMDETEKGETGGDL